jgi:hypothetical protein
MALAGPLVAKGALSGAKKLLAKKKKAAGKPATIAHKAGTAHRRRQKRIVFSENQWSFVQQLVRMAGHSAPSFPHRRSRRRRRF